MSWHVHNRKIAHMAMFLLSDVHHALLFSVDSSFCFCLGLRAQAFNGGKTCFSFGCGIEFCLDALVAFNLMPTVRLRVELVHSLEVLASADELSRFWDFVSGNVSVIIVLSEPSGFSDLVVFASEGERSPVSVLSATLAFWGCFCVVPLNKNTLYFSLSFSKSPSLHPFYNGLWFS